jgi:hypothetical protein
MLGFLGSIAIAKLIGTCLISFSVVAPGAPREVHEPEAALFDQNNPVTVFDSKFIRPMATAPLGLVASLIAV